MFLHREPLYYTTTNFLALEMLAADVSIKPSVVESLVNQLKNLSLWLITLTVIDQINKTNQNKIVSCFGSYVNAFRVYLTKNTALSSSSITKSFSSAIWLEREAYDLFGVYFIGGMFSDIRRLLTEYNFVGHPFKKTFPTTGFLQKKYFTGAKTLVSQ